jgi:hypothetical protein
VIQQVPHKAIVNRRHHHLPYPDPETGSITAAVRRDRVEQRNKLPTSSGSNVDGPQGHESIGKGRSSFVCSCHGTAKRSVVAGDIRLTRCSAASSRVSGAMKN